MKSWGFSCMHKQWIPGHFSLQPCGLGMRLNKSIHCAYKILSTVSLIIIIEVWVSKVHCSSHMIKVLATVSLQNVMTF